MKKEIRIQKTKNELSITELKFGWKHNKSIQLRLKLANLLNS